MNILSVIGKTRVYKCSDGYKTTGSYIDENGDPILADKWEWIETIEVDTDQLKNFYHEQIIINAGSLKIDSKWEENLMCPGLIRMKEHKYLQEKLDIELSKQTPDPIEVVKIQNDLNKLKELSDKQTYELALNNLDSRSEVDKPKVRAKLESKIQELS